MSESTSTSPPSWKGSVPVIDSHQHFWDRSRKEFDHSWQEKQGMEPICRSFMPGDLEPFLRECGVDRSIFVQTQHDVRENRWALELTDRHDFICGVVGWVDLASVSCEEQLIEFVVHPKSVGVRHVVQDELDPDFILRDVISRGLNILQKHNVPFDLLFYEKHLKHVPAVASRFPNLRFVIDHLSKPAIRRGNRQTWASEMIAAAACENVWCKLSGLVTEADWNSWTTADLQPYVDTVLELFGPRRLMFGSDWPVCNLAASYRQVFDAAQSCLGQLSDSELRQVFGQTAIDFYRLEIEL